MSDETLDDIEKELEQDKADETAKEGELLISTQEKEDQEKFKKALEKGYQAMGLLCGGINKIYPFVVFGEDDKQAKEFIDRGAFKTANVLKKYDVPEPPEWFERWQEEIEAGIFFGAMSFSVLMQVREHKEAEATKEKEDQEHGKESKSEA